MGAARLILATLAAGVALSGAAFAAISDDAATLARATLTSISAAPADKDEVLSRINSATQGAELAIITEALCGLQSRNDLADIVGPDAAALLQAQATLNRPEVGEALGESCEVARLALASYGATGGVPAGAAPGQAFGSGGVGAPGGGGGSGYTN